MAVVVEHFDVSPRRHRSQVPHETAHGTHDLLPDAHPRDLCPDGGDLGDAFVTDRERALKRHLAADARHDRVDDPERDCGLERP